MHCTNRSYSYSDYPIYLILIQLIPSVVRIPLIITLVRISFALSSLAMSRDETETAPSFSSATYLVYLLIVLGLVTRFPFVKLVAPIPKAKYSLFPCQ